MKILILGGTRFIGRHLVEAAQARNHEITLFNRGQTNSDWFPDVEKLRGDRDGGLDALGDRRWDAAIDTCGYVPRVVRASAERLAATVNHYTFISSISAYAEPVLPGTTEDSPTAALADETIEEITGETYGPLKVLCEQAVEAALPGRTLVTRPGLIVGPFDPTDRFTYWPVRMARGGSVLVPDCLDRQVQVIDGRDLAGWIICMVETGQTGTYNAAGPADTMTFLDMLNACQLASGSTVSLIRVAEDFLQENGVEPWTGLPLWLPSGLAGIGQVSNTKAVGAGLTFRPLVQTARDTLAWHGTRPADHDWRAGITPEKECEVIAAWQRRDA